MLRLEAALGYLQRWDDALCWRFNRVLRVHRVKPVLSAISWLGDGVFWYGLMLALLLTQGSDAVMPVLHLAAVGILCTTCYKLLKRGASRPRPYEVHAEIALGAAPLDRFSFPSGHTLHAVAFSLVACSHYPVLAPCLGLFTLLTAFSRVSLGLHYPSDVIAGALVGGTIAAFSLAAT